MFSYGRFIRAFLIGGIMMNFAQASEEQLITHSAQGTIDLESHRQRLRTAPNLTLPLEEELALLEQIHDFALGRFLLTNRGLNGYWTSYLILHGPQQTLENPLEQWLISKAPAVRATRERFNIFQEKLTKYIVNGVVLASIPCGLMDDLLSLNYSAHENIKFVGIDLDENSLRLAQANAEKIGKAYLAAFSKKDAWNLKIKDKFDVITSNGLNIYERDDAKVIELYKQFYQALKPGGILITSFLTPPPTLSSDSTWKNFNPEDTKKQKAIFADILQVKWQAFRIENQTKRQLEEAGFKVLEFIYDSQGMFPTVVAQK